MSLEYSDYSLILEIQADSKNDINYEIKKYLDIMSVPDSYKLSVLEGDGPDKYVLLISFSAFLELRNSTNTVIKANISEQESITADSLKTILNVLLKSPDIIDFKVENKAEVYNLSFPE